MVPLKVIPPAMPPGIEGGHRLVFAAFLLLYAAAMLLAAYGFWRRSR